MQPTRLLTPGEVARILRVEPKTVSRWGASGKLPCVITPGGHRRFRAEDVERLVDPTLPPTPSSAWSTVMR